MLPSADKLYGDADFIFQQDSAPAHTAKGTKSWFNDHSVTVLDWPANSPDLNPRESRRETPDPTMQMTWTPENLDERHQTQQCRWPEPHRESRWETPDTMQKSSRLLSKQTGLHNTWAVSQTDHLPAAPHWFSNSCKSRPTKYWVHRNEHTFQKPEISV